GVLGAVLWWWNPLTLGIGHVLGIDVPFTLAALLVAWALLRYLRAPAADWNAALLGLACGGALVTRHTGLIVTACAPPAAAVTGDRRVRHTLMVVAVTFGVVWM